MPQKASKSQTFQARLAGVLVIVLLVISAVWYGFSEDVHQRFWQDIAARPGGPMTFRFILQPLMAAIAAFADGVRDARAGRSPYLWALLTDSDERGGRLGEGLIATGRIILLGLGMDGLYQYTVLETFYPAEMGLVAILLAFLPYVLLRGLFARLARRRVGPNRKPGRRA